MAIDRNQMGSMVYGVEMDHSNVRQVVWERRRTNPPHPGVLIGCITNDFFLGNKQRNSKQRGFSRQLLLPPRIEHY